MRTAAAFILLCTALTAADPPQFYRDVQPILARRCQSCHQPGDAGPMPLVTYADVRPWASAVRESVKLRKMPPWFADPAYGHFANDPKLPADEIALLNQWVEAGAPEGKRPKHLPGPPGKDSWSLSPDIVITMPHPFPIPAKSVIEYQYIVLPLTFTYDRWVRGIEIRPSDRRVVHHAVLYVRPPSSPWLRDPNGPKTTTDDILAVYVPGTSAQKFPDGMAKKIPAGSDLVLQLHYTSRPDEDAKDQTSIGLLISSEAPKQRILTLQMGRDDLRIPPGDPSYRASVSGSLPRDATILSLLPHMHLRGAEFTFEAFPPGGGQAEMLLRVKPYNFFWQYNYVLERPRVLPRGTILKWTGTFDNSRNNPMNPDPSAEVTWGEQSWQEMMIGFFDVAVDPHTEKKDFFARP